MEDIFEFEVAFVSFPIGHVTADTSISEMLVCCSAAQLRAIITTQPVYLSL